MLRSNASSIETEVIPLHPYLRWPYKVVMGILAYSSGEASIASSTVFRTNPDPARAKFWPMFRNRPVAVDLSPEAPWDILAGGICRTALVLSRIVHSAKMLLYLWVGAPFNLTGAIIHSWLRFSRAATLPSSVMEDAVSFATLAWSATVPNRAAKAAGIRCCAARQWVSVTLPSQPMAIAEATSQVGQATALNGAGSHH